MTERKPPGVSWESFIDRQIRQGQERGAFDRLRGAGRPIADLDRPLDEMWWVRRKLADEGLGVVPVALQLRRDVEIAREQIAAAHTEHQVRRIVAAINARIREVNRTPITGPPSTSMPMDVEEVVAAWRAARD